MYIVYSLLFIHMYSWCIYRMLTMCGCQWRTWMVAGAASLLRILNCWRQLTRRESHLSGESSLAMYCTCISISASLNGKCLSNSDLQYWCICLQVVQNIRGYSMYSIGTSWSEPHTLFLIVCFHNCSGTRSNRYSDIYASICINVHQQTKCQTSSML